MSSNYTGKNGNVFWRKKNPEEFSIISLYNMYLKSNLILFN